MGIRGLVARYLTRARHELRRSFLETSSAHQIAGSFALGAFITMLPTWGLGLLSFVVIARLVPSINRIALVASVLVFNPIVKWGVYAASLGLGFLVMGSIDPALDSSNAARAIIVRLLVGNIILALGAIIPSYAVVYWLVKRYRARARPVIDTVIEEIDEPIPEDAT